MKLRASVMVMTAIAMALVASRWLLPLCAQTLPPFTLHRLWDL